MDLVRVSVVAARRAFLARCLRPAMQARPPTARLAALVVAGADRPCNPPLAALRAVRAGLVVVAVVAVGVAAIRASVAMAASAVLVTVS